MKNIIKVLILTIIIVPILSVCSLGRKDITFNGDEGKIVFSVKKDGKYKLSTNKNDFRTTREQAVILGDGYKIGIEFDDDFDYFYKGDFNAVKKAKKKYDEYKEVKYSNLKGIQYFYIGYMRYEIIIPIKDNKKTYLVLTVNGKKNDEKSAKEAIENQDVQDILNHIKEVKVKN